MPSGLTPLAHCGPAGPGARLALGRSWLAAGAIVGLVLAMMQPQWGEDRAAGPRQGRDLDHAIGSAVGQGAQRFAGVAEVAGGVVVDELVELVDGSDDRCVIVQS